MDVRNFTFMFYGFLAVWLILAAYVISIVARERKLKGELESLKKMISDREREPLRERELR